MVTGTPTALQTEADEPLGDEQLPGGEDDELEGFEAAQDEPLEEESDPRDERIAQLESDIQSLKQDLNPSVVRAGLGRLPAIQQAIDELRNRPEPQATSSGVDERVDATEDLTTALANALVNSELVDDTSRASLTAALQRVDQSRSKRERAQMLAELREEVRSQAPSPAQGEQATIPPEWQAATDTVAEAAQDVGLDPNTIPREVWAAGQALGTPGKAAAYVLKWVNQKVSATQEEEKSTESRVTERRRAAGSGTPARGGKAMSDEEMIDDYGLHPERYPYGSDAWKRVSDALDNL